MAHLHGNEQAIDEPSALQRGCRALGLSEDLTAAIQIVLPVEPILAGVARDRADRKPIAALRR